jgi:plasmid stabilization system protein ParE
MEVFVTARAEKNFDSIVEYINQKWGNKTAQQFIQKTDDIFNILKSYPLLGQVEKGNIRGLQLSSQTRLLYRITNDKVIILAFFDVRQDPKKKFD